MSSKQVSGSELKVGDVLVLSLDGTKQARIVGLSDYPKFAELCPGYTARIARTVGAVSGITVPDSCLHEVAL